MTQTDWYTQTQSIMQKWTETQQQVMNGWMQLAGSASSTMMNMWQEMAQQGVRQWTADSDSTVQQVADKMFTSQSAMMRFVELTMKTWQSLVPTLEGDWQSTLTQQMETIRKELLHAADEGMAALKNVNHWWQTYVEQWQSFGTPWLQAFQQSLPHVGKADGSSLVEMTSLYWDAYQETFGKLLQAPGIGYTREIDEKLRRSFAAWLDVQQASYEYQVVLAETWVKAFEQLMVELVEYSEKGETVQSVRDLLERWSATADHVFKAAFVSDAYIYAQGKLINATMLHRSRQREVNEMALKMLDLPTRTEIDEAHRRIYELRKEVKALKKQLAALTVDKKSTPRKASTRKTSESQGDN